MVEKMVSMIWGQVGADVVGLQSGADRFVAAGNVEADAGRRNQPVVCDDATNGHRIPLMRIGTKDGGNGFLGLGAALDLIERVLIRVSEHHGTSYGTVSHAVNHLLFM